MPKNAWRAFKMLPLLAQPPITVFDLCHVKASPGNISRWYLGLLAKHSCLYILVYSLQERVNTL